MNRDEQPQELKRVVIKEELVKLTGHWRTALILNQFLYWLQRHRHYDQFLAEEQVRTPDLQVPFTYGWIYKSAKELQDELMIDVSEVTLRRDIKLLVDRQWLAERHNPSHKWDRELQYRPDIRQIQRDLQALGYALEGYPLLMKDASFTMKDASFTMKDGGNMVKDRPIATKDRSGADEGSTLHHEAAIPEIPPETTPEIPPEIDDDVVARLEQLGLTHDQAIAAYRKHQLDLLDVEAWATWKRTIPLEKRPDTIFAGLIRKQRLPPGTSAHTTNSRVPSRMGLPRKEVAVITSRGSSQMLPRSQVWQAVVKDLTAQVSREDYETWLRPTSLLEIQDGAAIIATPNVFVRQELESRYLDMLTSALQGILGYDVEVQFVIDDDAPG